MFRLSLGFQSDDGAGLVEESAVVLVTVDDGLSPVRLWNLGPEDYGYRAPVLQDVACLLVVWAVPRRSGGSSLAMSGR